MNSWDFVSQLKNGWNLGNTLDAVARDIPNPSPEQHETAWYNPLTSEAMINLVKDAGFGILRIPTTWYPQVDADFNIKKEWMQRVQEITDWGLRNGLTVILNLHHEDWHFPSEENYPAASEKLQKLWKQIAEHFASYDNRLVFEAMNEPRKNGTDVEWTGGDAEGRAVVVKLNADFVKTVRATGGNNTTRMLMLPTYAASSSDVAMSDFSIPEGDPHLIVSVHAYTPYDFALVDDMSNNIFTPEAEKAIDELFTNIEKYFTSKKIPVIMGECGARDKKGNLDERVKWAKYYTDKAKKCGVPCIWWDNGAFKGDGEVFGIMNREKAEWTYPAVVEAFLA